MVLRIYQFNNYYNRILKYYEDYEDYGNPVAEIPGVNFNPNDRVNATQIINYDGSPADYALLCDENNDIVSRWYIIDNTRTRAGQYQLLLFRDTLADYKEEVLNATTYIEKAWITNMSDPAIYNLENFTTNEIKKTETLLKDKTESAWIVGYYDKKTPVDNLSGPVNLDLEDFPYTQLTGDLATYKYYQYVNTGFKAPYDPNTVFIRTNFGFDKNYNDATTIYVGYLDYTPGITAFSYGSASFTTDLANTDAALRINRNLTKGKLTIANLKMAWQDVLNDTKTGPMWQGLIAPYLSGTTEEALETFINENGKLLKTNDGKFYRVKIEQTDITTISKDVPSGDLFNVLSGATSNAQAYAGAVGGIPGIYKLFETSPNNKTFQVLGDVPIYSISFERVESLESTFDLGKSHGGEDVIQTEGVPYNIFAIPFNPVKFQLWGAASSTTYGNPTTAITIATAIIKKLQSYLYDIQLLPYFPAQELISGANLIKVSTAQDKFLSFVKNSEGGIQYPIIHVSSPAFTVNNIPLSIETGKTVLQRKVNRQCDKWRLCSPNYANYFDFSVESNDGINYFTVDCDYKPGTPYIHINPNFKGLYGRDFNDPRGLVLGGDFSLTQIIDKWQEYTISNKNYELIFGRQIENLEIQAKYGKMQDITNAITGTVSAGATGYMAGSMISGGNPIVGGIGAGVSALASGIAGWGDVAINQKLRDEAKNYATDLYNYQLQNIQALPTTLSKVSAYNSNNKIFPVLEYYTCTNIERQAFENKLKYNGMTIDRIGVLSDFIEGGDEPRYYKGQLIRININDSMTITNTIANELNKGVFI